MDNPQSREHYVNNEQLLKAFIQYRGEVSEAENSGEELPQVPDYIAKSILKIATRLSYKSNFINYGFREDMVSDAVENCLSYILNFDPDKSKNPFAYFTQIIYYAFLRRIQKEKKQLYIKYKSLENSEIMNELELNDNEHSTVSTQGFTKVYDNMREFVETYESNTIKKKEKAQLKNKKKKKKAAANNLLIHIGEE
jgi:DNA-directed RNA polymerase specialized sigma24 family protein